MCLIAFAIGATPACPLLVAANRDEFFGRPTAALHRWELADGVAVVGGRDLRDGGTWLGAGTNGRVAMLTNVRNAQPGPGKRSRGELATRWLRGDLDLAALQAGIDPAAYGGFNLVVGDVRRGEWAWLGNRDPEQPHAEHGSTLHSRCLAPGVYGLSNAALDTPWPKTLRLKRALADALRAGDTGSGDWQAPLTQALANTTEAADAELPDTGMPPALERGLSSPFVRLPGRGYGTRSSLLLRAWPMAGGAQRVQLDEWTHAPDPEARTHRWSETSRRRETLAW